MLIVLSDRVGAPELSRKGFGLVTREGQPADGHRLVQWLLHAHGLGELEQDVRSPAGGQHGDALVYL